MSVVELAGVSLSFGGVQALDGVGFSVREGELFSIIGPNGAGKTSVFNCVSGVYRPQQGTVRLRGADVTGRAPHRIAASGVARTFQNVEVFKAMTVIENLMLGRHHYLRSGLLRGALWVGRARREEAASLRKVAEVIDFLGLQRLRHRQVGSLPHGLQKRVELGRALAMEPGLLLLDEPVAGMNQEETEDMVRAVLDVRSGLGVTIVLVEHDMGVVMQISDRVAVLDFGRLISIGTPDQVTADPAVRAAYLGTAPESHSAGGRA